MAPFERAMVVSYRLSIVTVALCNHSAAQINRGVGHFGPKFPGVPRALGVDH